MSGLRGLPQRALLVLAGLAVAWERLWPRLWPIVAVVATFLAVALLDILPRLPGWLHALTLIAFALALLAALWRALSGLTRIRQEEARRRLERDSGLDHRPLEALDDRLLAGADDPVARHLWQVHRQRMAQAARRLRVRAPSPGLAKLDPRGLRVLVLLLGVIAVSTGLEGADSRVLRALEPRFAAGETGSTVVDVWLTPPAYTGLAPLFLSGSADDRAAADAVGPATGPAPVRVPTGSTVLAQVTGPIDLPRLIIGERSAAFTPMGSDAGGLSGYRVESVVAAGDRLEVRAGRRTLARWPLQVIPDAVPTVELAEPPSATADAFLHLAYRAEDDYGIHAIVAVIQRPQALGAAASGSEPAREGSDAQMWLPMPLPDPGATTLSGYGDHDLAAHPWAGHEVLVRLEAEDGAGQVGVSPSLTVRLPEREFTHPVARAVIAARKRLTDASQQSRRGVADTLAAIASEPETFASDMVVSLALAVAQGRLRHDRREAAVPSTRDILWDTALRIEQGTVPVADRRLRQARQDLLDALRSDASDEEIERLMTELQQALDEYLAAVAAEMARQGLDGLPPPPGGQMLRSRDLQDLIDMARQMARSGARDSAHDLLSQLQRILDDVRAGLNASRNSAELMEAQRLLQDLQRLADRQQTVLDQTYDALRQLRAERLRGGPSRPPEGPAAGAAEQESLRQELGDLMLRLDDLAGSIPAPLGEAERAMRGAADALEGNRLADAVPDQTTAVERLRAAADAAAQALSQQLGAFGGMFAPQPGGFEDGGSDPFGRFGPDALRGLGIGDVDIPDRMQLRRVEEILDELRRRAGDAGRPAIDREYIERLLRRF